MKIMMLITGLGCGGAEHQVTLLADKLHSAGHRVCIVTLTGHAVIKPSNEQITISELNTKKSLLGLVVAMRKCIAIVKRFSPDVVHSHMVHANIFARLLRIFCKLPKLICTAHSTNEGGKIRMWLYRMTDGLCDLSTNVSQEAVDRFVSLKAVPAGRMVPVYNAIDTDRFYFNSSARDAIRSKESVTGPLLLAVGRLDVAKDYPNLLQASSLLLQKIPGLNLWIAGEGPLKNDLVTLAEKLNISLQVKFLGLRKDVQQLMCAADVFVLSSAWEGFGLVVAEALACERNVVATDCGGVREVLGSHGQLVEVKSPERLAEALFFAVQNSYLMNKSGREHVENSFSAATLVPMWEKIYAY